VATARKWVKRGRGIGEDALITDPIQKLQQEQIFDYLRNRGRLRFRSRSKYWLLIAEKSGRTWGHSRFTCHWDLKQNLPSCTENDWAFQKSIFDDQGNYLLHKDLKNGISFNLCINTYKTSKWAHSISPISFQFANNSILPSHAISMYHFMEVGYPSQWTSRTIHSRRIARGSLPTKPKRSSLVVHVCFIIGNSFSSKRKCWYTHSVMINDPASQLYSTTFFSVEFSTGSKQYSTRRDRIDGVDRRNRTGQSEYPITLSVGFIHSAL
jgi:hypothetical protein